MRKFLKVYIWVYLILGLIGIITLLGKEHSIFEIFRNTIFWSFAPICVFLYIYGKKWLPYRFWKIYFFLKIADAIYDFFYLRKSAPYQSTADATFIIGYLFGIALLIPIFIAIYRYAFKRNTQNKL